MITVLLEKIITILEGWIQSFTSHAQHVEDKLDSLDQTASDIETNTEPISDIKNNTGAVITPIQNIKTNTDSIATSSQTSANNTTAILNNVSTLSTNTGRAAAFAEDCANNTLDIKDKVTTIASDTTQIRATDNNIYGAVNVIKDLMQYYFITNIVTEDSEGVICNFDTDLEDYLQACKITIPADPTGYTGITLTKCGKNLAKDFMNYSVWKSDLVSVGDFPTSTSNRGYKIPTIPGKDCSLSFNIDPTNIPPYIYLCKTDGVTSSRVAYITTGSLLSNNTYTFTPDDSLYYLRSGNMSTEANFNTQITKCGYCQIEFSSAVTPYEAFSSTDYPVSFGQTITDGAEADLLSGLVKVNTTPVSFIQIQPIAVRTYKGVNNIYSDVGTSALTYRETLKHYLDKNNQ